MNIIMKINRTQDGWDLVCDSSGRDYHIRHESDAPDSDHPWALDEFDSAEKDNNSAHVESSFHKDITDALHAAFDNSEAIAKA